MQNHEKFSLKTHLEPWKTNLESWKTIKKTDVVSVCLSVSNVSSKKLEKSYRNIDKGNEIEKRSVQTVVRPDDPA